VRKLENVKKIDWKGKIKKKASEKFRECVKENKRKER
jgi:hypothetical protein